MHYLLSHIASIVNKGEVCLGLEVWFEELVILLVFTDDLLHVALVCGLGEPALFIQEGEYPHGALNEVDAWLQIQAKVNEAPLNPFCLILFLMV